MEKKFTYKYSQPEEYHFSLDSIEMPKLVADFFLKRNERNLSVLDLCSGCGVIGFEFHFYFSEIQRLDFVEVQKLQYQDHFKRNLEKVLAQNYGTKFNVAWDNYAHLFTSVFESQYDLILCNPPYFELGQGKMSPSEFKNRCRFFLDSSLEVLISFMIFSLKAGGEAYFLLRSLSDHNKNLLRRVAEFVKNRATLEEVALIRGTHLLKIKK